MNKEYKLIEGNYKHEDEVVYQVDTITSTTTSSIVNIGEVKKEIESIDIKLQELNARRSELLDTINSTKIMTNKAIK